MIDKTDPTNRDTVQAMLTPGEFVLNKEAVQLFGPKIEAMNQKGLQLRQHENNGGHIGNFNIGGAVNISPVDLSVAGRNHGGMIPGYNWGGWISSLFEPDENSVIGQNLNPAHIRATPPGYGAEVPEIQQAPPEFVPQAQPGQQVQGGFGAGIPEEFSGGYRPEQSPTYITDIPQVGDGAQHDRSTIIPTEASIPYAKGEQANLVPPTQASVIQAQAEQVVPGTDEALLQTSSDYASDIVSQQETDPLLAREAAYARDRFAGQEGPGADIPLQAQDVGAVPPGYGAAPPIPQEGTGAQHGRDDLVTTNPFFDSDRDGSYFTKTNDPLLETEYDVPPDASGYGGYSPEDFLAESQGIPPEDDGVGPVDWNELQGAGFGGPAINEEVEDKVIQEATFEADNAIESAKAQEANLLQQAQAAADQGDFAEANRLNEEATGIVDQAEQDKIDQVGALEEQYAAGKQARIDAENQWRASQGEPPKPPGEEIVAPDGEGGTEVIEEAVQPNSEQADAGVADVTAQAVEAAGDIPADLTTSAVETAGAKASPQQKSEGKSAIKEAFGDLIDNKELGRMALLFAGALLTGASPQQALAIAGKSYLQRVDAKNASKSKEIKDLTTGGKYTPKSVSMYAKTGNIADLQAIEKQSSFKVTGKSKDIVVNGKRQRVIEVKDDDGNVTHRYQDGSTVNPFTAKDYEPSFDKGTPEYRTRRSRATKDSEGRFEEVQKNYGTRFDSDGKASGTYTKIGPKQAADEFWAWAEENNIDPESDEALQIQTNAYQEAINDGKGGKITPTRLRPYLESQALKEETGYPELFTDSKGNSVRGDKMQTLKANVDSLIRLSPADLNKDHVYNVTASEWNKLDGAAKAQWNKRAEKGESGFYLFMNQNLTKLASQL